MKELGGIIPALVTPFDCNNNVDSAKEHLSSDGNSCSVLKVENENYHHNPQDNDAHPLYRFYEGKLP